MRRALLAAMFACACGGSRSAAPEAPAPVPAPPPAPDAAAPAEPAPTATPDAGTGTPVTPSGQGVIRGTVTDAATGRPLAGATVLVHPPGTSTLSTTTDARGQFALPPLPAGSYEITFAYRKVDFRKQVTVDPASETVLAIALSLSPTAPVIVH